MKRTRLLSLAIVPVMMTQCAPRSCTPAPAPPPPSRSACDPNYSGCVPIDSDVDCEGGSGNGPSYTGAVRVIGTDIYGLDGDGDGWGCNG